MKTRKNATISRRVSALLLTLLMLLPIMLPMNVGAADGGQLWETEDHNLIEENAVPIPLSTVMNGSLYSGDDWDFYRFTIPADGYAEIVLTYDSPADNILFVTLTHVLPYEMFGAVRSYFTDDDAATHSTKIGVYEGSYVLRLLNTDEAAGEVPYKLTVNFTPDANWKSSVNETECEPNNHMDFSDFLPFDTPVSGVISLESCGIYNASDTDFYRIEVKEKGFLEIRLTHGETQQDGKWDIGLYGTCSSVRPPVANICWFDVNTSEENWRSSKIVVEPGEYWIRLTGEGTEGIPYQLSASLKADDKALLNIYETEENNSTATADPLAPGATVRGNIGNIDDGGQRDRDYYRIDVAQDGHLKLQMRCAEGTTVPSGKWGIGLYRKESGNFSSVGSFVFDAQSALVSSPEVIVNPGTYYALVYGTQEIEGVDYEISYVFREDNYVENIGNDYTDARDIRFDTAYRGVLDAASPLEEQRDYDYYKVEVPANGHLEISLCHRSLRDCTWFVEVFRIRDGELERVSLENFESEGTEHRSRKVGAAPDTYYISVNSPSGNLRGEAYTISVSFTRMPEGETAELEDNNSMPDGAMPIPVNTVIHGALSAVTGYDTTSDVDCFEFELPRNGRTEIEFAHDPATEGKWILEVYADQGTSLEKLYTFNAAGDDSAAVYLKFGAEPGRYFIKIRGEDQAVGGVAYRLTVHYTETAFCENLRDFSYKGAKNMILNTAYGGYYTLDASSSAGREVDFYKIIISREGTVRLEMNHKELNITRWRLDFYRFENQLTPIFNYTGENGELNYKSDDIAVAPGTYYIKITATVGKGSGDAYSLTVHSDDGRDSPLPFTDVPSDAWYTPYVSFAVRHSLFNGTSATTFSPNMAMSRAMFVQLFANLDGVNLSAYTSTPFDDAPLSAWYGPAVAWAAQNGVVNGTSQTTFAPDNEITREQMCVMIVNYAKYKNISLTAIKTDLSFGDAADISDWAREAVDICAKAGIINGKDGGVFDPQGTASRAEVATLMTNFCRIVLGME